jgi:hypothetical protein
VRASAERGRVQGPGRAEADFGPKTLPVVLFRLQFKAAVYDALQRFLDDPLEPLDGSLQGSLDPPLDGSLNPSLNGSLRG